MGISRMDALHRFLPEPRHGVVQHAVDRFAIVAAEALFERREPGAQGVERRIDRARGLDAGDADVGGRLIGGEQQLVQTLAGTNPAEHDLDPILGGPYGRARIERGRRQAGQAKHRS